ncbi:rhodanese-like domain-containing protein [Paenibacillus solisilvae]|uniref:Rhodanese-like domain-containing protein n=1 Tax=Paenibacillus solisilvae TaxID=2486751 RepID=A0ABW0W0S3_9BACL
MERWTNTEPEHFLKQVKAGELTKAQIIDVREQEEWDYYHIETSTLIPLQTIPNRLDEFQSNGLPIYIFAHTACEAWQPAAT